MTREEIIKGLENYIPWADEYEVDIEVLTGALELLKQEPCGDAISRQAVINLIRRCNSALEEPRIFESHHSGNIFEHYITELPPVNHKTIINNGIMDITL